MISRESSIVLNILRREGFEAYLVGGCVRDLLLNKIPKDFDVITTAKLKQIKKQFHRAEIVGRRFPICMVHVRGLVIEVSSFETVAQHAIKKEDVLLSQIPGGCDKKDLVLWRNSMDRDFTINSLFFDPFVNRIYDYANGMMDLRSLKLQTLIPAQLSFREDCARILRGVRIAARLGLSFSKEIETAICELSPSLRCLSKSRIMMEVNYMLSYGAAEPSLRLLQRFNLLEILFPFHAAYLAKQATKQSSESSVMLMRLFFHLDKVVTCDRPSDSTLWVGLLAFHLALVMKPQHAFVVWTFASVLYHGKWNEGVKFAREHARASISFVPEISENCDYLSDDLAERVSQLALLAQHSIGALTETNSLQEIMAKFPDLQCSGSVFVSNKMGTRVAELFSVLTHDAESYKMGRQSFEIDYHLLGKGILTETRFVLGKVIVDSLSSEVVQVSTVVKEEKNHLHTFDSKHKGEMFGESCDLARSDHEVGYNFGKENKKRSMSPSNVEQQVRAKKHKLVGKECELSEQGIAKKQKAVVNKKSEEVDKKQETFKDKQPPEVAKKHSKEVKNNSHCVSQQGIETCHLPPEEIITTQESALENNYRLLPSEVTEILRKVADNKKCQERDEKHLKMLEKEKCRLVPMEVTEILRKVVDNKKCLERDENHLTVLEKENCHLSKKQHGAVKKCHLSQVRIEQQEGLLEDKKQQNGVREKNEKHKQEITTEKRSRSLLSSLFK
ncbi:uncharacterized protein LOC132283130 isoform X2 [Cornus florida]|nr:uncharacterized protein LOC132283130 isoform X2 [Cornus florida]